MAPGDLNDAQPVRDQASFDAVHTDGLFGELDDIGVRSLALSADGSLLAAAARNGAFVLARCSAFLFCLTMAGCCVHVGECQPGVHLVS